ncbi:MAG: hypothetical protein U0R52_10070 [Solirubrobacterales bacterium]
MTRREPRLPIPEKTGNPEIDKALRAYRKMETGYADADAALVAARENAERAREQDRLALAAAKKAGKADPGQRAEEEANREVASALREAEACDIAAAETQAELLDAISQHSGKLGADLDGQITEARERCREDVAALISHLAEVNRLRSLRFWLREPGRGYGAKVAREDTALLKPSGDPYRVAELIGALDAALSPEGEQPVTRDQRTWRREGAAA